MRRITLVAAALAGIAGIQTLAQTVDGLDLDAIKRRSGAMAQDAGAFADQVRHRGDAFREEALAVRKAGTDNLVSLASAKLPAGPDGPVDFDEIIKGAGANVASASGDAPQFIVFASLSMPPQALRQLFADTARAGGVVVFRGFPNNSFKLFREGLTKVVGQGDKLDNVGIDPRLFRAFAVQAVPTYVAVSSDFDLCSGFDCTSQLPPHDRMTGNVTVAHALETFANGRGPGAGVASIALRNMGRAGG